MNRHGRGKWPCECPICGCPGVVTKNTNDPADERTVWGYEAIDTLTEQLRIANAVIDAGMPRAVRDELMAHYDPKRGLIAQWCEDTRQEEDA